MPPATQPRASRMTRNDPARHVLPDLLASGLRLLFCGSAAGRVSALKGLPYAGPGNKFWPTLHAVGLTPRLFAPSDWQALGALGIGITDLNKAQSGSDTDLSVDHDDVAALVAKVVRFRPQILAFTAKRPAQVVLRAAFGVRRLEYGPQPQMIGETAIFVLPSPSGRAGAFWDVGPWDALARRCDLLARR
jgi:double-stranded uracil-DNA glycosylase